MLQNNNPESIDHTQHESNLTQKNTHLFFT